MRRFESTLSVRGLLSGEHRKPTLILLIAPLLLTVFKYYGSKAFFLDTLAPTLSWIEEPELAAALYAFLASLVLLGIIPLMIVKWVFKEPLSSYGIQIGDAKFGLKAFLVMAPVMMIATWLSSKMPEFLAEYPLYAGAGETPMQFVMHAGSYLFFYLGWEFFFRGFMQFGLRDSLGDWNAILVQTLASCLLHIGKPDGEIFGSILAGIVWGIVVFRARSILYVLLVHWILGVALDFFIVYF